LGFSIYALPPKKSYKTVLAGILIKLTLTQIIYVNKHRNESMNATWDIALEHCPPDGDLNGFYQALRDSLTEAFQKIDLEEFTVDPPPDWAIGFIHKYNFENEL